MGKHCAAIDIANGINALHIGLHVVISDDATLVCGDIDGIETQSFGARSPTCCHEYDICLHQSRLALAFVCHSFVCYGLNTCLHDEVDSFLGDGLAQAFGYIAVECWQTFF